MSLISLRASFAPEGLGSSEIFYQRRRAPTRVHRRTAAGFDCGLGKRVSRSEIGLDWIIGCSDIELCADSVKSRIMAWKKLTKCLCERMSPYFSSCVIHTGSASGESSISERPAAFLREMSESGIAACEAMVAPSRKSAACRDDQSITGE